MKQLRKYLWFRDTSDGRPEVGKINLSQSPVAYALTAKKIQSTKRKEIGRLSYRNNHSCILGCCNVLSHGHVLTAGVSATFGKRPVNSRSAKCSLQCAPLLVVEKMTNGKEYLIC